LDFGFETPWYMSPSFCPVLLAEFKCAQGLRDIAVCFGGTEAIGFNIITEAVTPSVAVSMDCHVQSYNGAD